MLTYAAVALGVLFTLEKFKKIPSRFIPILNSAPLMWIFGIGYFGLLLYLFFTGSWIAIFVFLLSAFLIRAAQGSTLRHMMQDLPPGGDGI